MSIIIIKCPQDMARLRRLALASQGLLQANPYGTDLAGARKAINHIGYIQIDTISVVEENRGQMKVSAKAEETCLVSNSLTAERAIDTVIEIDKS